MVQREVVVLVLGLDELRAVPPSQASAVGLVVHAHALGKPYLTSNAILNSASFAPGLTPMSLQTLFGASLAGGITAAAPYPWPVRINDVEVLVNGNPQPLVYVSEVQINFYLADAISGADATLTNPRGRW